VRALHHHRAVLVAGLAALVGCSPGPAPARPGERAPQPTTLAAGDLHSCAIVRDGEARCWGTDPLDDGRGALPEFGPWEPVVGVPVAGLPAPVRDLAVGYRYSCAALTNGQVACWGRLDGDPHEPNRGPAPLELMPGLADVVDVAVGHRHGCAVTRAGAVWCWGANRSGEVGDGTEELRRAPVDIGLGDVAAIAAHRRQTCALHRDGAVSCWGDLSDESVLRRSRPFPVRWIEDAVEVAIGERPCVRHGDGKVECWSWVALDGEPFSTPAEVLGLTGPVRLALGPRRGCALEDGGRVVCWDWPATASATPIPGYPLAEVDAAVELSVADAHTCARLAPDGEIVCWGDNDRGQLGDGLPRVADRPRRVAGLADIVELSAGPSRTCARASDGALRCWGEKLLPTPSLPVRAEARGWSGTPAVLDGAGDIDEIDATDVGLCTRRGDRLVCLDAADVPGDITGVRDLDLPLTHGFGCWAAVDGRVACWGYRGWSHCSGAPDECRRPHDIAGAAAIRRVALGDRHGCGVDDQGAVWCWGHPPGETGRSLVMTDQALRVDAPAAMVGVAAGVSHTCAWTAAGELSCWGTNVRGELGDGTTTPRDRPTRVALPGPVATVAAGSHFTCALLTDGRAHCWGAGTQGQLGDGTRRDRPTPAPVDGLADLADLTAGLAHACARTRTGDVWCWGQGASGQLGQGVEQAHAAPIAVAGL
jgi:alpha-tubulin suppressor-like RCC1 family protein